MVEIKYPDGSKAQYHENGDRVKMKKGDSGHAAAYRAYRRGDEATICQRERIYAHPLLAYFTVSIKKSNEKRIIPGNDLVSLEKPRISMTRDEAQEKILRYDENGIITTEDKPEGAAQ